MRAQQEVALVVELRGRGLGMSEIARLTGVPYRTVTHWLAGYAPDHTRYGRCALCDDDLESLPREMYVYLLGLYLGDGCIYTMPRGVHRLAIFCTNAYPVLMEACSTAIRAVISNKVGLQAQGRVYGGVLVLEALAVHVPAARAWAQAQAQDRTR